MSYVSKILQPGEEIRHRSRIHWLIYLPAIICIVAAIVIAALALVEVSFIPPEFRTIVLIFAAALALIGIFLALKAWITRFSTELVVTDRRIIYKRGLIRRYTAEMNMEKVETVLVEQGIVGRIFDYGTIVIRGTGGGMEPLANVDAPLDFRNHVTGT